VALVATATAVAVVALPRPQEPPPPNPAPEKVAGVHKSEAPADAATAALAVLTKCCHRCHGQDGLAEGGFNFVTEPQRMRAGGRYLVAGQPERSRLLKRARSAENPMPPAGESPLPTEQELQLLRDWIAAGAPDPRTRAAASPSGEAELGERVRTDLESLPETQRKFIRYLSLVHLRQAGFSEDELHTWRLGTVKLLNSLSWKKELYVPVPLGDLLRLDLRQLGWDSEDWAALERGYPYKTFVGPPGRAAVREMTETGEAVLRADWFAASATRPPQYHRLLRLPESAAQLEQLLGVSGRPVRAGFARSGVSSANRLIERRSSPHGAYWQSFDFVGSAGRRSLFSHPLGPDRGESGFLHDGGEILFHLPNGLLGSLLVDGKGRRLDRAPVEIVSDPRRPDRRVVNGLSCLGCHAGGMIAKEDELRAHVLANPKAFAESERSELLALHVPGETLQAQFAEDGQRTRDALRRLGIVRPSPAGEPVTALAVQYESEVDLAAAAAELGLEPEQLSARLAESPTLGRVLGGLRVPGTRLKRETFAKAWPGAAAEIRRFTAPGRRREEVAIEVHVQPAQAEAGYHVLGPASPPLRDGDKIQVRVVCSARGYVYLFWADETGKLERLWPADAGSPAPALAEVWVPPLAERSDRQEWRVVAGGRGTELILAAVSDRPLTPEEVTALGAVRVRPAPPRAAARKSGEAIVAVPVPPGLAGRIVDIVPGPEAESVRRLLAGERKLGGTVLSPKATWPTEGGLQAMLLRRFSTFYGLIIPHE
jgi:hypothetical protein